MQQMPTRSDAITQLGQAAEVCFSKACLPTHELPSVGANPNCYTPVNETSAHAVLRLTLLDLS